MVVLKCKMCGGTLDVQEGMTVCECEYCGSKQTIPNIDNEKKIKLFDRANRLRINCEFDKAGNVYESIIEEFPEEAEGYWGILLCKYGIEYVDDPATGDKVPTCHRASFESIMDDEDFEMVMENADSVSRSVYREQAKQIEELRKGIMEVSSKEAPYDIFICYKEADENGDRTIDSVIAQDVYDALTGKGYRVFFSRISLEDKLGTEYEPYIFAALNSAKVMLAFGTSYDYYNAVWVKNEWSRFLRLMAKNKGKYLIPCYKDIDAYDIPKEFAKLQAQDMGKVGALQDLLRGIDKIFGKDEAQKSQEQQQAVSGGANVKSLLKRGYDALEDGAFDEAKGIFNDALNSDPESAEAYLGLFMADIRARDKSSVKEIFVTEDYTDNRYWNRAKQYAGKDFADELNGWEYERSARMKREAEEKIRREEESCHKRAEAETRRKAELADIRLQIAAIEAKRSVIEPEEDKELESLKAETDAAKKALEQAESEHAAMPERTEVKRIEGEIVDKQNRLAGLGFFKGKEKKILQEQISALEQSLGQMKSKIENKVKEVNQLQNEYRLAQNKETRYKERITSQKEKTINNEIEQLRIREQILVVGTSKVGDKVYFGRYRQGNGFDPIEWRVLETGDKLLLITEYGIVCKRYNEDFRDITWEECSLRRWLNQVFYKETFNEEEKSIISNAVAGADTNPKYSTDPGNDTNDKVILLSIPEVLKFMPSDEQRKCKPLVYAKDAFVNNNTGGCFWWLRSPGKDSKSAADIDSNGGLRYKGGFVIVDRTCVRPALWIDLSSPNL